MFRKISLTVLCTILLLLIATLFMRSDILGKSQAQRAYLEALHPDELVARNGKKEMVEKEWQEYKMLSITILQSQDPTDRNEFYRRIDWKGEARWLNTDQYAAYERLFNPYQYAVQLGLIPIVYCLFLWMYDNKEASAHTPRQQRKRRSQTLCEEERREIARARIERHRSQRRVRVRSKPGGRR